MRHTNRKILGIRLEIDMLRIMVEKDDVGYQNVQVSYEIAKSRRLLLIAEVSSSVRD